MSLTFIQIIFLLTGVLILFAAIMVVTSQRLMHSALWLILTLFGVAIIFILLQSPFLGVVQVVVYIGAIAILVIFAVMLTRRGMSDETSAMNKYLLPGVLAAVVFFVLSTFTIMGWPKILQTLPELPAEQANLQQLGQGMVSPDAYLLPFEVASILLLSALIGAIYIGREKQHDN